MGNHTSRFWVRSPAAAVVAILILVAAGSALAASGAGSLITGADDNGATARTAQQPLGTLSAQAVPEQGVGGERERGGGGNGNGAGEGPVKTEARGQFSAGPSAPGGGGGQRGRLPFTGLVAIPLLVGGAGLLVAGVLLRRRSTRAEPAA